MKKIFKIENVLVLIFLLVFLFFAAMEARGGELDLEVSHSSNAGTKRPNMGQDIIQGCYRFPRLRFCAGGTFASGEYSDGWTVSATHDVSDFRFGVGYISTQSIDAPSVGSPQTFAGENMFVSAVRVIRYKQFYTNLGVVYFQNTNRALGSNLNFALQLGWSL